MVEPLISVDSSDVREGKLDEVMVAMKKLADFVEANEPRVLAYEMSLDREDSLMTVVQVHPDSASMESHMEAAAHLFPTFADLLTLRAIDLYGDPSEKVLDLMRRKAHLLGDAPLAVHKLEAGFVRGLAGRGIRADA